MGTTYSNCQVRTDSQEAVVAALTGLLKEPAYVAPAVNGWVGVYPEGDSGTAETLAKKLSAKLSCGVFYWSVYDSDIFFYTLYEDGKKRDEFDSNPDYFETVSAAKRAKLRGKPEALVPYCLPGIGYLQVQEVLQPPASPRPAENTSNSLASLEALPLLPGKSVDTLTQALEKLKQDIFQKSEEVQFADEQAEDLATLLGMDNPLASLGFQYLEAGETEGYILEDFHLVGISMVKTEPRQSPQKAFSAPKPDFTSSRRDNNGVPGLVAAARTCSVEFVQGWINLCKAG